MKQELFKYVWPMILASMLLIVGEAIEAQQKLTPAQQLQQAKNQITELKILLRAEKEDTRNQILEIGVLQGNINQLNQKLLQTQNILGELVKDEKIKIEHLKPLVNIGFRFGNVGKLPSALPDTTKNSNDVR